MLEKVLLKGESLPEYELLDDTGAKVTLRQYWEKQKTIFVFLRHFGCQHCRAQAVQYSRARLLFEEAGLGVVFIGLGDVKQAKEFREEFFIPYPVLFDPTKQIYKQFQLLKVSPIKEMQPSSFINAIRDTAKYGAAIPKQSARQLGGVFIADTNGRLVYVFRSERASIFPDVEDTLEYAREPSAVYPQ